MFGSLFITHQFKLFKAKIPILDRYILSELFVPFIFGMGLFTTLSVSIGVVFDLVRRLTSSQLTLSQALQMLLLRLPEFIGLSIPMSVLLATLIVYSRLVSDSESIALQAGGVSIYRLFFPSLMASLLMVGMCFFVNDFVAPEANYQATAILDRALNRTRPNYQQSNIIYPEYQKERDSLGKNRNVLTFLFYAREFDGQNMKNLTIFDRSQKNVSQIITGDRAIWNEDLQSWNFFDGVIYTIERNGTYSNVDRFATKTIPLSKTPWNLALRGRKYTYMNIVQAREYLEVLRLGGDPKSIRKLEVNVQERISLPFVCIIFAAVGGAIGLQPQNKGKATSFGICIILIFGYYLFSFITGSMGVWGVLSPFMAAWLPNFIGLGAGGLLLFKQTLV